MYNVLLGTILLAKVCFFKIRLFCFRLMAFFKMKGTLMSMGIIFILLVFTDFLKIVSFFLYLHVH